MSVRTQILLLAAHALLAQPDRFGLPACELPGQELATRSAFVLCHSASLRVPVWTAYEITPERLNGRAQRPRHFRRDLVLAQPGASDSDYRNSGWVRGHLVPAADMAWSEDALRDSFLFSNAVPQNAALNSGKWRVLEGAVRKLAAGADFVLVFTGPVFCPDDARIGANQVAVPCQIFKVVVAGRGQARHAFAAILPNGYNPAEPLAHFACSIAEVERRTGLDFLNALPGAEQAELESTAEPLPGLRNSGPETVGEGAPAIACKYLGSARQCTKPMQFVSRKNRNSLLPQSHPGNDFARKVAEPATLGSWTPVRSLFDNRITSP
ncbi:MAG: DNA/RNA non-specific endonuclease [Bryobacteraceae bacterium]